MQYELHAKKVNDVMKRLQNQVQNIKQLQKIRIKLFLIIKKAIQQHLMECIHFVNSVKPQLIMDVSEDVIVQLIEMIFLVVASELDHVA